MLSWQVITPRTILTGRFSANFRAQLEERNREATVCISTMYDRPLAIDFAA